MKRRLQRRLQLWMALVAFTLLITACSSSDKSFTSYTTSVDLRNSAAYSADQGSTTILYSLDNGASWTQFPLLKLGDKYSVVVQDDNKGFLLNAVTCAGLHWEGSVPAASDTVSDSPTFVFAANNHLAVKVLDKNYTAYVPAKWTGNWTGVEGPLGLDGSGIGSGSNDAVTMTEDPVNPNQYVLANFFGDGTPATVILVFNTSTNFSDQTLTMASQTVAADPTPNTASGTGTYDQCHGTFTLAVTYVQPAFGGTFTWTYNFHR